jgi:hypothetical protein
MLCLQHCLQQQLSTGISSACWLSTEMHACSLLNLAVFAHLVSMQLNADVSISASAAHITAGHQQAK